MKKLFLILIGTTLLAGSMLAGRLTDGLELYLSERQLQDDDKVTVMLSMREQADIAAMTEEMRRAQLSLSERNVQLVSALQETAAASQVALIEELSTLRSQGLVEGWTSYWLSNLVVIRANVATVRQLAARADVEQVEPELVIQHINPVYVDTEKATQPMRGVQPGIDNMEADRVWYELGEFGENAIVAGIDTGVMGSHVSFADRWYGNGATPDSHGWLDLLDNGSTTPIDNNGHGTHTMGTMVGASADTIGMAPGALWVATNPIDQGASGGFDSDIIAALQWVSNLDGAGTFADVAQNSWGVHEGFSGYYDCDSRWWTAIDNCEALGTVLTWSAGNEGPGSTSLRSPADRATTPYNCFSVGSTLYYPPFEISSFSSRGPSGCGGAYATKPEVVAPGSDIYSAYNNGGYTSMSGTSMAGPHVAGAVALMRSANENLEVDTIKELLMDTANDLGAGGEDNVYGWGFVDTYEAVLAVMSGWGTVQGTVTSNASGLPIEGVVVAELTEGRNTSTDSYGDYEIMLPADSYTMEFSAFGFQTATAPAVVPENGTVTVNMALTPAASATLSGHVYDNIGTPMSGALVTVLDTPVTPVYTNSSGYYSVDLPTGTVYTVRATSPGWGADLQIIDFTGSMTVDFNLTELTLEDYETGDFTQFPWSFDGNANWVITTDAYEGSYCAVSGDIGDNQTSTMSVEVSIAVPGDISFMYRVSSESNYDYLRFYIDGSEQSSWSGEVPWTEYTATVSAGLHTFTWSYTKDIFVSNGSDCAWVDYIVFPTLGFPDIAVAPDLFDVYLNPGEMTVEPLHIDNNGAVDLNFSVLYATDGEQTSFPDLDLRKGEADPRVGETPRGQGGPDSYGYVWIDSDETGGPVYDWVEINGAGSSPGSGDDANYGPFALGFDFSFYGTTYDAVRICTNGWLSFTSTANDYNNDGIPNGVEPNTLIAPFWDDLNPSAGGTIYYYADAANNRFIVEWDAVPHYYNSNPETFQVILNADGSILYQYETVALGTGCTVGIENLDGSDGLQVVFNADYLHNGMAILLMTGNLADPWLSVSPTSGTVPAYDGTQLDVTFDAAELGEGVYNGSITVNSNDPDESSILVPVTLTVGGIPLEPVDDLVLTVNGTAGTLSWSAAPGATYYKVYVAEDAYGTYSYLGETATLSFGVTVTAEKRFYHVVAAN